MAKVKLDWKSPTVGTMVEYVDGLKDADKKEFAKECSEKNEDGKNVINPSKAKNWLLDKVGKDGDIEWANLPKGSSRETYADKVAKWLEL